jgi:hypothetical protein
MIALMTRRLTQPAELSDAHLGDRDWAALPLRPLTLRGHVVIKKSWSDFIL